MLRPDSLGTCFALGTNGNVDAKSVRKDSPSLPTTSDYSWRNTRSISPGLFGPEDVVSLRCGVRGLAVAAIHGIRAGRRTSRSKYVVHRDRDLPWVTIHGGKFTSCVPIAELRL